ncbi:sensor domain-containing diguanylate cyclase [Dendrosporobacter sp. 1207_IL3150]|uniref:sensor domain-containing diguanylate cyclase n=1 Tax=Dendrosporobacter sp. 1207_IL3150 TaxID=3084054 RepID=UPI002FDB3B66
MKLSTKIKWVVVLLLFFTAIAQIIGTQYVIRTAGEKLIAEMNEDAANNQIRQLRTLIDRTESVLNLIAKDKQLQRDKEHLDTATSMLPDVNALIITNDKGDIVKAGIYDESLIGQNVSYREYFQGAMQGNTVITGVFQGIDGRQVIAIAVPIKEDDGSVSGVVVGLIWVRESNLAELFDHREFGRNGLITILDREGNIVYHSNKNRIGNKHVAFNSVQTRLEYGNRSFTFKDKDGIEYYASIAQGPKTQWIAVVQTPVSELEIMQKPITYGVLITLGAMVLIFLIISSFSINMITKPLVKVTEAFNSLRSGKYQKIKPAETGNEDEIIELVLAYNQTVDELEQLHAKLSDEAEIDGLTGIYNRRSFNNAIESLKNTAQRNLVNTTVLFIDLDYFKRYNDTHGHLQGDDLLKKFAKIMSETAGERSAFRYGGDEFAVILRGQNSEQGKLIGENMRTRFEQLESGCTLSVGVASIPEHTESIEKMLDYADKALYTSKLTRNKVTVCMKE